MVYWKIRDNYGAWTDFSALVDSHATMITNRALLIGSDLNATGDAEKGSKDTKAYEPYSQIAAQIAKTRSADTQGWVMYDYGTLNAVNYWDELSNGPFEQMAVVPFMWWQYKP
jgi:hypothetical protein